jgi:outer membrane lipoprotein-sorting protein
MHRAIGSIATLLCAAFFLAAQPAPKPPHPTPLSAASTLDEILDALDARGQNLQSFTADVSLTEGDASLANEQTRRGKVLFQDRNGQARLRVTFTERDTGKRVFEEKIEYLLDNGWLTDRTYSKSIQVKREVLRPGEKINLLKLGEGPFPLPIGQKKESVKEQFEVKKIAPTKSDPADTAHVLLTPKPETKLAKKFDTIDVWVDFKTHMPARIDTVQEENVRTTELKNFKANPEPALKDDDFKLPPIDEKKWDLHEEGFTE